MNWLHILMMGLGGVAGGLAYVFPQFAPVLAPIATGLIGWAAPQPGKPAAP